MLRSSNTVTKSRYFIIAICIIFLHLILAYRFFQLQVLDYDLYSQRSDNNRIRATSIPAPRGLIRDRNGEIIVDNYPTYVLFGIGAEILDINKNFSVISHTTGIDTSILSDNYKSYNC